MTTQTASSQTEPSRPELSEPQLLQAWKRATQEGLKASRAHCQDHALLWHQQALQIALQLLHSQDLCEPVHVFDEAAQDELTQVTADDKLAALVVAHLNLGDCYADLRELDNAADCMSCAHHQLLQLIEGEAAPDAWRMAAYRHLRETHAALLTFCSQHGEHPKVMQALHRQAADQRANFPSTQLH